MAGLQTDDAMFAGYAEAEHDQYILEKKLGTSHDHIVSETASHELDGIHDGLEFPTDEERETLRRVPDSIPWNAYRRSPSRVNVGSSLMPPQSLLSLSCANAFLTMVLPSSSYVPPISVSIITRC